MQITYNFYVLCGYFLIKRKRFKSKEFYDGPFLSMELSTVIGTLIPIQSSLPDVINTLGWTLDGDLSSGSLVLSFDYESCGYKVEVTWCSRNRWMKIYLGLTDSVSPKPKESGGWTRVLIKLFHTEFLFIYVC